MKPLYPLRRTCKQAVALMIAREDRELPRLERWALRLHLAVCKACPNFERQLLTMRQAMGAWRHYSDDEPR
ncbi:MAG: zf-HC2 domain-containing protein [Comamonadaceae bacterium]|jgi:hypothetical protein|uniref:Zf-HC2 domain-containing protein n=1 Tax=Hydrogenophaga borbori TaxID=2294117 RepID=A0A372EI33_9BURK|nr:MULTISPECIES: zf-HC2 domain-containing protein [Hydrogenophaga]NCT97065.1 zf-HC2 domain-containing protein [Comamonadaceae bacterium]RFP78193.1 zf-HC2 domain-containing protein [Hydrogenophaga borbori]WQB82615.1 zf-HC2 domain-containing protein [Hydrogenophaga sp. SNF1]